MVYLYFNHLFFLIKPCDGKIIGFSNKLSTQKNYSDKLESFISDNLKKLVCFRF